MHKIFKNIIQNRIERKGGIIIDRTPKESVITLINKLHPKSIDKELIRLGPNGDGGYLVPNDLNEIEACFSPGVDKISQFEKDCLERGMKIFLADRTVDKPNFDIDEDKYSFLKKHIGCTNNDDFITMDEWVRSSLPSTDTDLLLQMDIEGGEFFSFINISDKLLQRFRIIIVEFHDLHKLWNPNYFNLTQTVFDKILQTHSCIHIHPNNCTRTITDFDVEIPKLAEFTFLRNDRFETSQTALEFPHKLDYDNTKKTHIALPTNWYKS